MSMTIGQLAARTGLPVRTLRFYADAGVLPEAGRSDSGYRLFDADAVARARLVRTLRALGVGLETEDCAVIDAAGRASSWLFALGPLTRPAWWEVTAVPEINLQIDRLVAQIAQSAPVPHLTSADFLSMGEGI